MRYRIANGLALMIDLAFKISPMIAQSIDADRPQNSLELLCLSRFAARAT